MFKPDYKNENDKFWTDRMYYVPSTGKVDKGGSLKLQAVYLKLQAVYCITPTLSAGRNTDPFKQDKDPPLLDTTKKTERRMSNPYDPRSRKVLDLKTPIPRGYVVPGHQTSEFGRKTGPKSMSKFGYTAMEDT